MTEPADEPVTELADEPMTEPADEPMTEAPEEDEENSEVNSENVRNARRRWNRVISDEEGQEDVAQVPVASRRDINTIKPKAGPSRSQRFKGTDRRVKPKKKVNKVPVASAQDGSQDEVEEEEEVDRFSGGEPPTKRARMDMGSRESPREVSYSPIRMFIS